MSSARDLAYIVGYAANAHLEVARRDATKQQLYFEHINNLFEENQGNDKFNSKQ